MKVEEFSMFIHGPFATNIYVDAQELQKLKGVIAEERLTLVELNILNSLSKQKKAKGQLIKELTQDTKITTLDILLALKNLRERKPSYVQKTTKSMMGSAERQKQRSGVGDQRTAVLNRLQERFSSSTDFLKKPSEDYFSITQEGKDKLDIDREYQKTHKDDPDSEAHIAKEKYYLNRPAINQFWSEIEADTEMSHYTSKNQLSLDEQEQSPLTQKESFFSDDDRPVLLAIFNFEDFKEKLTLNADCPNVDLKFCKNTVYVYPTGVGVFSSEVTVRYSGDDFNKVKYELEREVNKKFWKYFRDQGSKQKLNKLNDSIMHGSRFKLVEIDDFRLELAKVATPAWTHTIYWFYGDTFFKEDITDDGIQTLTKEYKQDFTDLLQQSPKNMIFLKNRLVFYGWGRSLILTEKPDERTKDWVKSRVKLAEIGQYSTFGYILLQYLLQRALRKLTTDESIVVQSDRSLKKDIERIDNIRLGISVFLEEFRSGIGTILLAAAPYLAETLKSQWQLNKVEENITSKLESLNNERSAREQSLITQKQDRMNLISSAFTIMGIASVTAAIVALYPLNKMFRPGEINSTPQLYGTSLGGPSWGLDELTFFVIATVIIIGLAIGVMFKWHEIKRLLYVKGNSWKHVYDNKHDIRNISLKLAEERSKEVYSEMGSLKRKIKDLFDKREISRSQYEKLMNELEQRETRKGI
jgi:hypothetical protein